VAITSRIAAGLVVLALLSTATLAVRGAMQERRGRAEQAFRLARQCALTCAASPSSTRASEQAKCRETASNAAELSLEMPEHDGLQLELQAALDELAHALESGDGQRLTMAIDRCTRAGSALGWAVGNTRLP